MQKFLKTLALFSLPIIGYFIFALIWLPRLLKMQNGPNTEDQILFSTNNALTEDYDLLILGNSRTYRGVNPDKFSCKSLNYSHDNDSYNQIYYKLELLLGKNDKKFKALILGVDYFQFNVFSDSRNYVYGDVLGDEYLNDYDKLNVWQMRISNMLKNANPKNLMLLRPKKNKPFLRSNGQFIKPGKASETDYAVRSSERKKIQVDHFTRILDLCRKRNILCYIVMPPARPEELSNYTSEEMKQFNQFIDGYVDNENVFYLNYSLTDRFSIKDYTDITHLNEAAADVFSTMLDSNLVQMGLDCN